MYFFYYFPVGIDARVRRVPLITATCTALCVLVFVLNKFFGASVPLDFRALPRRLDCMSFIFAPTKQSTEQSHASPPCVRDHP